MFISSNMKKLLFLTILLSLFNAKVFSQTTCATGDCSDGSLFSMQYCITTPVCGGFSGDITANITTTMPNCTGCVEVLLTGTDNPNTRSTNVNISGGTATAFFGTIPEGFYVLTTKTPIVPTPPPGTTKTSYVCSKLIQINAVDTLSINATLVPDPCPVVAPYQGAITGVSGSGGNPPYTYDWADLAGTNNPPNRSGLEPGIPYTLTVTDSKGCTKTQTFTIDEKKPSVTLASNPGAPICDPVLPVNIIWTATPEAGWTLNPAGSFSWDGGISWGGSTSPTKSATSYGVYTQSVIFRDINNCQANATLPVPVDTRPVFTASANPTSICPGLTSLVTANLTTCSSISGVTCQYSFDNGGSYGASNVYTTPPINQDTTIIVRVTNGSGCFRNASVPIDTAGKPRLTAVVPTICPGAPYTINVSCSANCSGVQLNFNGGGYVAGSPQSYTQPQAPLVNSTTTFTLSAKGGNNCINDTTVTVVIFNNTLSITKPADTTACANNNGSTVTLTATGFKPATTITWSSNPAGLPGDGSTANPIQAASPTSGTVTYTVTGTDAHGCYPRTATQSLVIKPQPTVAISGPAVNCEGTSSTLLASGGTSYSWYNATYSTLLSSPGSAYVVSETVTTTYNVIGTDANGCKDSATYLLPFQPRPTGTASLSPSTICSGNTTTVSLNANAPFTPNAGGGYSISDGATYTDATTTGPTIVTFPGTGPFFNNVTINTKLRDNYGCLSLTIPVTLTVSPFHYQAVPSSPLCSYSTNGSILIKNLVGGSSPSANYSLNSGTAVPFTTSVTIPNLTTGTYALHVVDNSTPSACSFDTTISVIVPSALVLDTLSSNDVVCNGDANGSIPVKVTGGTTNFTYYLNNTTGSPAIAATSNRTPTYTGLSAGNYDVIVVDGNGCKDTVLAVPIVSPPVLVSPSITPATFCYGTSNGVFTLSSAATGGWGGYTYTFNGSSVALNGSVTGLSAGSYTLVSTDSKGCSKSVSVTLTSSPQLYANVSTVPSDCGTNGAINYAAATGGTPPYTYSLDNVMFSSSVPAAQNPVLVNTTSIYYVMDSQLPQGCKVDTTVKVLNIPRGIPVISVVPPTCPGGSDGTVTIDSVHVKNTSVQPYSYVLLTDKSTPVQVGTGGPANANVAVVLSSLSGGNYILKMSDVACSNYVVDSFRVYTSATAYTVVKTPAQNNPTYAEITVPKPAGFTTSSVALASDIHESTGSVIIYNLTGGTPFVVSGKNNYQMSIDNPAALVGTTLKDTLGGQTYVSYKNLAPGLHTVFIRDMNGCSDTIHFEVPGKFFIPNLVSPNHDGHNEVFEVISLPDNSILKISNRWGERIYESKNYNNSYDFAGLSDGVYYYDLEFETGARFKGWVQVLR